MANAELELALIKCFLFSPMCENFWEVFCKVTPVGMKLQLPTTITSSTSYIYIIFPSFPISQSPNPHSYSLALHSQINCLYKSLSLVVFFLPLGEVRLKKVLKNSMEVIVLLETEETTLQMRKLISVEFSCIAYGHIVQQRCIWNLNWISWLSFNAFQLGDQFMLISHYLFKEKSIYYFCRSGIVTRLRMKSTDYFIFKQKKNPSNLTTHNCN